MLRIGTRGSALALAQAGWVAERLPEAELVTITTAGDRGAAVGDKSRWTTEIERALVAGEIDLAVHSAKDVPSELAEGTAIVAVPAREDPLDGLIGAPSLEDLPPGARVGTSSLRRAAQIRARRTDLEVVGLRGNVDTRLRKLDAGEAEAIVLAVAGLARLGLQERVAARLDAFVPAAGQGALAVQGRSELLDDPRLDDVRDRQATRELAAERELVGILDTSCLTPIGIHASAVSSAELRLRAWLGMPDGSVWLTDALTGPDEGLALTVAERLRAAGADQLLLAAERSLSV